MKQPILGNQNVSFNETSMVSSFQEFVNESNRQEEAPPLYTGRYFAIETETNALKKIEKNLMKGRLGFQVSNTKEFKNEVITESAIEDADVLVYDDLGFALVGAEDEQMKILSDHSDGLLMIPEEVVYVPNMIRSSSKSTWGIKATKAAHSSLTGKGVKVAVLDTGFDLNHPDFMKRAVVAKSFVPNENEVDGHGHGTHCIGTACGNVDIHGKRYGVAKEASIYSGKVLSNSGRGAQAWIFNGINWAIQNKCQVISMSLGSRVLPGQGYHLAYERAANFALSKGSIIVAAAGNGSRRNVGYYAPVGSPANCTSILAVGAVDANMNIAPFSNRSINPDGQVDIAAPGVGIYSSWPMPSRNRSISGTSMATPHVAGILALLWEAYPNDSSYQIINRLKNIAKRLSLLSIDVGVGLSLAP